MSLNLSLYELKALSQAVSYGVVNTTQETEAIEFAQLKSKVEGEIAKRELSAKKQKEHSKKGCLFQYCSQISTCNQVCIFRKD